MHLQCQSKGFDSQEMHELLKCIPWMQCKSLQIKASAKCINVHHNAIIHKTSDLIPDLWKLEMHRLNGQWSESDDFSLILPIPSRFFYSIDSGTGRDVTATRKVACKHVVSRENDSNFIGIQCKRRMIMFWCHARWGLHSLNERVRETAHTK